LDLSLGLRINPYLRKPQNPQKICTSRKLGKHNSRNSHGNLVATLLLWLPTSNPVGILNLVTVPSCPAQRATRVCLTQKQKSQSFRKRKGEPALNQNLMRTYCFARNSLNVVSSRKYSATRTSFCRMPMPHNCEGSKLFT
jgi:hypothetical protein